MKDWLNRWATNQDPLVRIFRNSAWLFSSRGLTAVLSIFYLAILTRTLGPAGFGQFILIVSLVQIFASFLRFSCWQTVAHFGGPALEQGDNAGFAGICWLSILVELAGSLLSLILLFLCAEIAGDAFGWSQDFVAGILIYGLIFFLTMRSVAIGILRVNDRFRDSALAAATIPVVRLLGALFLLATSPSLNGFLIVWGLSELSSFIVNWAKVIRGRLLLSPFGAIWSIPAGYWSFLFATHGSNILKVLRERGVVLLVGFLAGEAAAGLFRLADQLAGTVNRLTEIFAVPLFTEMSRLFAANDTAETKRLFWRSLKISAASGAVMMLLLVLLGRPLIELISGAEFLPAYPIFLLLGAATIFNLVGFGLEPMLQAAGKAHISSLIRLIGLIAMFMLIIWCFDEYGVIGAASSILVTSLGTGLLLLYYGWRLTRKH